MDSTPMAGTAPADTAGASIAAAATAAGPRSTQAAQNLSTVGSSVTMDELVEIKFAADDYKLYPNHGFARGGVGHLVATGGARAGINRLPQMSRKPARGGARSFSAAPSTRPTSVSTYTVLRGQPAPTLNTQGGSSGAAASGSETTVSVPPSLRSTATAKPWEKGVPHASDFVSTSRSTRIYDVPAASKWSGLSFYENDPAEIKRHLDIMGALDQLHVATKHEEKQVERERHQAWAAQQRETFHRQRRELAMRYQQLGLSPRPSYAWAALSYDTGVSEGSWDLGRPSTVATNYRPDTVGSMGDSSGGLGLPPPGFGASRAVTADDGASRRRSSFSEGYLAGAPSMVSQQASQGAGGEQGLPRHIPLPKPTFTKIYDRMGAEIMDSPRLKAEMWRRNNEAAKVQKEQHVIKSELAELEGFEDHLASITRQKARSQYAQAQS